MADTHTFPPVLNDHGPVHHHTSYSSLDLELTRALEVSAPTFSSLPQNRRPTSLSSCGVDALDWGHEARLVGKKVSNPMLHSCDVCRQPILTYGRLMPCHHAFCFACATTICTERCVRCQQKVGKVKRVRLGSIFMCSYNGSRYGHDGCRRSYYSQRDLSAHVQHRHGAKLVVDNANDEATNRTPTKELATVAENEHKTLMSLQSDVIRDGEEERRRDKASLQPINMSAFDLSCSSLLHQTSVFNNTDPIAKQGESEVEVDATTRPTEAELPNLSLPPPNFFSEQQQQQDLSGNVDVTNKAYVSGNHGYRSALPMTLTSAASGRASTSDERTRMYEFPA